MTEHIDQDTVPRTGRSGGQPEDLITIDELANYLRVPKSWIYDRTRVADRIGFPVVRVGKYLRFERRLVLEWLARESD